MSRWTIISHHVMHGGYDRCGNDRYRRGSFALKSFHRRVFDWFDWIYPEAWNAEHNKLHHYYLNEKADPDLVEHIFDNLHYPPVLQCLTALVVPFVWRWFYYASNVYNQYYGTEKSHMATLFALPSWRLPMLFHFVGVIMLPYLFTLCVLFPSVYSLLFDHIPVLGEVYSYFPFSSSLSVFTAVMINFVASEILSNVYTFMIVVTNHCGDDLYRFTDSVTASSPHFVFRAAMGSVNYPSGTDLIDFLHGYLNYQIEHHMFPDLSALEYQRLAPLVAEICKQHNVPYIVENVFLRTYKTYLIMSGTTKMKVYTHI